MGTGLTTYRSKGTGHEVLAGDAVLWSRLDGGRCSVVGEPGGYAKATILG